MLVNAKVILICATLHVFHLQTTACAFWGIFSQTSLSFEFFSIPITTTSLARKQEDFWTKNTRLNRPMSPHLTIYR